MTKTIKTIVEEINDILKDRYEHGLVVSESELKKILKNDNFTTNITVGNKHIFVAIGNFYEIKARRKKIENRGLSEFSYVKLELIELQECVGEKSISKVEELVKIEDEEMKMRFEDKKQNAIAKLEAKCKALGITLQDFQDLFLESKNLLHSDRIKLDSGKLV